MARRKALTPIEILRLRRQAKLAGKNPEAVVLQQLQKIIPAKPKRVKKEEVHPQSVEDLAPDVIEKLEKELPPELAKVPDHLKRYSAVCCVCGSIGLKTSMRCIGKGTKQIDNFEDDLWRHHQCEAGSPNWMARCQDSKYYKYFVTRREPRCDDGSKNRNDKKSVRPLRKRTLPSLRRPRGVR